MGKGGSKHHHHYDTESAARAAAAEAAANNLRHQLLQQQEQQRSDTRAAQEREDRKAREWQDKAERDARDARERELIKEAAAKEEADRRAKAERELNDMKVRHTEEVTNLNTQLETTKLEAENDKKIATVQNNMQIAVTNVMEKAGNAMFSLAASVRDKFDEVAETRRQDVQLVNGRFEAMAALRAEDIGNMHKVIAEGGREICAYVNLTENRLDAKFAQRSERVEAEQQRLDRRVHESQLSTFLLFFFLFLVGVIFAFYWKNTADSTSGQLQQLATKTDSNLAFMTDAYSKHEQKANVLQESNELLLTKVHQLEWWKSVIEILWVISVCGLLALVVYWKMAHDREPNSLSSIKNALAEKEKSHQSQRQKMENCIKKMKQEIGKLKQEQEKAIAASEYQKTVLEERNSKIANLQAKLAAMRNKEKSNNVTQQ